MDDPKLISGEDSTKTRILTGSIDLFNINILPERYRRKRLWLVAVLPWLFLIILIPSLYPGGNMALEAQDSFNQINSEIIQIQTTMEVYQTASNGMETLVSEIEIATQHRDQILESYQGIDLQGTNWSETLYQIEKNAPNGIIWTVITQEENEIQLEGISNNYHIVLDLVDSLVWLDNIIRVQIESVDQVVVDELVVITPESIEEIEILPTQSPPYVFTILVLTSGESHP